MLGAADLLLLIALIMVFTGNISQAGPVLIASTAFLAIGFRGYENLKGFSYTVTIFAAVIMALYYPFLFIQVGDFKLTGLITPLIQVIMFGMGTSMSAKDFIAVAKNPRGVFIGIFAHFLIMPSLGFFLAYITDFTPEIAAGIIHIGCSPSVL